MKKVTGGGGEGELLCLRNVTSAMVAVNSSNMEIIEVDYQKISET